MRPACVAADVHIMNFRSARVRALFRMRGRHEAGHDLRLLTDDRSEARNGLALRETLVRKQSRQKDVLFKSPPGCRQLRPCTALPCDMPDKSRVPRLESLLRTHRKTERSCRG